MKNGKISKIINQIKPYLLSKGALSLGIATLISLISLNMNLSRVEAFFYDTRMRLKGAEAPHPDITLLVLGEKNSNDELGDISNWGSIDAHTKALQKIMAFHPKAIVYLNHFDPSEIEYRPAKAEQFVSLAKRAQKDGIQILFGTEVDLGGEVLPPYPLSLLPHAPALLHKDGTIFGEDMVMRRALLTTFEEPSIHMRVAFPNLNKKELQEKVREMRGSFFFKPADSWHTLIHYPDDTDYEKTTFPKVYFSEALNAQDLSAISGKIVLVETIRKDAMNDFAFTPYSRITYTNPRAVVHAAILDTILKNNAIIESSNYIDAAITFCLALILAFITINYSPSRGIAALTMLSILLFLFSLFLFKAGYWVRLVHPLVAMFFTYYLIVPYRAILEYKKRWEVQEKHDLLVQVEEMKGNFLSLMSHDLKTPVARIQGLAELILRQGKLAPEQESGAREILQSTESLDKFISKILSLTKVESNEFQLEKRSKDVNKLLEKSVEKLGFQAKNKGIEIRLSLEPLFPIQIDAAMIIQVFTNIIDNAIKYSPRGSLIEVKSQEEGDHVKVVIEDHGPGLDEEELRQLFTKFFRGKSHPGDATKGSGLGLYLSKYFIELHDGSLEARSTKGSGSKFIIRLPIGVS